MNDLPFNINGLCAEEIERLHETYKALKEKFGIQFTGHINFHLEQFEVFKNCPEINIRDSYVIKRNHNNDTYILFIETNSQVPGGKGGIINHCEHQTWALAFLKNDFGRVMIRRETLADKIIELIHPIELDFEEDKAFSDTFYVLVDDHPKAVTAINRNFRNAVMDIREDDFLIEIVNHTLIIGDKKPFSYEKALYLAEFVVRLASLC
ncbi:MAG TPA: hypothetical protein VGI43_01145 [Mucilaginibacter sp.]